MLGAEVLLVRGGKSELLGQNSIDWTNRETADDIAV